MKKFTYADLPALHAFLIAEETQQIALALFSQPGVSLYIKLNAKSAVRFDWPLAADPKLLPIGAQPDEFSAGDEVIPVDLGAKKDEVHMAIVKIGFGGHLLAK